MSAIILNLTDIMVYEICYMILQTSHLIIFSIIPINYYNVLHALIKKRTALDFSPKNLFDSHRDFQSSSIIKVKR